MTSKFSISDFIAETKLHGLARPNRFEVEIGKPGCIKRYASFSNKLGLYCKTAYIPQSRIITSRNQYFGPPVFRPIGVDYGGDNLTLVFYVDGKMRVKAYFDEWMDGIIDRKSGITKYSAGYTVNMSIDQLSSTRSLAAPGQNNKDAKRRPLDPGIDFSVYRATIEDAFPVAVNPLTLDQGSNGQVHELSVTFNYRRWTWSQTAGGGIDRVADNNINFGNDPSLPERRVAVNDTQEQRPLIDSNLV